MKVKLLSRTTVHRYANCLVTTRTSRVRLRSNSCNSNSDCDSLLKGMLKSLLPNEWPRSTESWFIIVKSHGALVLFTSHFKHWSLISYHFILAWSSILHERSTMMYDMIVLAWSAAAQQSLCSLDQLEDDRCNALFKFLLYLSSLSLLFYAETSKFDSPFSLLLHSSR
jgi:hypothetical protein